MTIPPPALAFVFDDGAGGMVLDRLPPPWYVPVEAPACGHVLHVAAEDTTDGVERRFVCDLPAGHEDRQHRQVTDNEEGHTLTWTLRTEDE